MRVLMTLENVEMDGVKRASTVLGNAMAAHPEIELWYYSLAETAPFFELDAPLLVAKPAASGDCANFFGAHPYQVYRDQIADLITQINARDIDTVILPAGLLTSFAPLLKANCPSARLVGWMHNNFNTYMNDYYGHMQAEFIAGLRAVDELVVLTDADRNAYSCYNPNITKIYNPLSLIPAQSDLSQKTIAFTGRIAIQHKGIDLLLEAAQTLTPGWQIAIAGDGTPEDVAEFQTLQDELGVRDKIVYRGALKDEALSEHYRNASIFVSTSRWEGMPLVIGEAMAAGLPIVAMSNTGSDEFLQRGRYGFLTAPADVADFSRHLNMMCEEAAVREHFAKRAKQRARAFSREQIVNAWLPLLEPAQATA
ncbi:glycosyltransferase [Lacticaseibacillus sp. GG6-2]